MVSSVGSAVADPPAVPHPDGAQDFKDDHTEEQLTPEEGKNAEKGDRAVLARDVDRGKTNTLDRSIFHPIRRFKLSTYFSFL